MTEHVGVGGVAELVGDVGDGPVVVTVLEGLGDGLVFEVAGDVVKLAVVVEAAVVVDHGALHHALVGELDVDAGEALVDGFGDDGGGVVAGHGAGLDALERPDGHAGGALVGHADEAVGEVGDAVGLDEGVGGVSGAVGVPEGEGGVVVVAGGEGVDDVVGAAVGAVGVVEEGGAEREVIERRVEDALVGLAVGGADLDLADLRGPLGLGLMPDGVEVPVRELGVGVVGGGGGADGGDAGLDEEGLVRVGLEVEDGLEVGSGDGSRRGLRRHCCRRRCCRAGGRTAWRRRSGGRRPRRG